MSVVVGVGTDIIEISRVAKACGSTRFLQRVFTEGEQALFVNKKIETVAGNFACKEAAAKALGCGFRGFGPWDVEVLRDELNKPVVLLHGGAAEAAALLKVKSIHASISHSRDYATAVVVMEGAGELYD